MGLFIPNPCLLGILLVVSTHSGPQLVHHYPPNPNEYGYKPTPIVLQNQNSYSYKFDETSSVYDSDSEEEDDDDSSSSEDDEINSSNYSRGKASQSRGYLTGKSLLDYLDEQDKKKKKKQNKKKNLLKIINESSDITGASSDPSSPTINDATSTRSPMTQKSSITESSARNLKKVFGFDIDFLGEFLSPPKQMCNERFELTVDDMAFVGFPVHSFDDGTWRMNETKSKKTKSRKSKNTSVSKSNSLANEDEIDNDGEDVHAETVEAEREETDERCPMNMFNLVFVMNPPVLEYNTRIDEMFIYFVSRLSLILRYEQSKSNYVWEQVNLITRLKEDNFDMSVDEMSRNLISKSSLARIMSDCYKSVSSSSIANLHINGKLRSFQIPIKKDFESLPSSTTSYLPGSYLSSLAWINNIGTTYFEQNQDDSRDNNLEMVNFALLLLDDADTIIKDIQAEDDSVLAGFIRALKPTESLTKLSSSSGFDMDQIQSFANHLIYWRRARAIPPLQTRSVYIVSPMAPISNLQNDIVSFKNQFPSLPSLPSFLSLLSSNKSRQFSTVIPSKDHREIYLEALSWLIRWGYVTQLHTFIWLKISNQIKIKVEEELEKEGKIKRKNRSSKLDSSTDNTTRNKSGSIDANGDSSLLEGSEANNTNTANIVYEEDEETIILDPERATSLERKWIAKCIEGKSPELTSLFYKLIKYMNGKNPLEMFLIKESISRQELRKLLYAVEDHIITVRHW